MQARCAIVVGAALLSLSVPASAVAEPQGSKQVFRDAGAKYQGDVLATAALYARAAEAISPSCAHAERLVAALKSVNVKGLPKQMKQAFTYIVRYGSRVLGVDGSCATARKFEFAAIGLSSTAGFMYPTFRAGPRTVWLVTTIHYEDRTWPRPDICRWKLSSGRELGSTVRYLASSGRCLG